MRREEKRMNPIFLEIGGMIEKLRKEAKITIEDLRQSIGISNRSYYHILRGKEMKITYYHLIIIYLVRQLDEREERKLFYINRLAELVERDIDQRLERREKMR